MVTPDIQSSTVFSWRLMYLIVTAATQDIQAETVSNGYHLLTSGPTCRCYVGNDELPGRGGPLRGVCRP